MNKLGRPASDSTARVREIMEERQCAYGTAYAQMRREAQGSSGRVGRPPHPRISELMAKYSCTKPEAQILLRAEQIMNTHCQVSESDSLAAEIQATRLALREARLAEDNEEVTHFSEVLKKLTGGE
jgi:hypothetical protein